MDTTAFKGQIEGIVMSKYNIAVSMYGIGQWFCKNVLLSLNHNVRKEKKDNKYFLQTT